MLSSLCSDLLPGERKLRYACWSRYYSDSFSPSYMIMLSFKLSISGWVRYVNISSPHDIDLIWWPINSSKWYLQRKPTNTNMGGILQHVLTCDVALSLSLKTSERWYLDRIMKTSCQNYLRLQRVKKKTLCNSPTLLQSLYLIVIHFTGSLYSGFH